MTDVKPMAAFSKRMALALEEYASTSVAYAILQRHEDEFQKTMLEQLRLRE